MSADEKTRTRILELLNGEGYETDEEVRKRLGFFLSCIEKKPRPDKIESLLEWIGEQRRQCTMQVEVIPMQDVKKWSVNPATGGISHESGEFFEVIGLKVTQGEHREQKEWCQPIIYQREMGILGIIRKNVDGAYFYLLQAKAEPGNLHKIQLSPTLQATMSNLRKAHGGRRPLFADYFENPRPGSVVYATYQTEDGGRLHLKTNLNMIVEVGPDEIRDVPSNFRWVTMYEIKQLLKYENIVNLHVRSIISPL